MRSTSLKQLRKGAFIDYIDGLIQKVVDNVNDPNTEAKKKRQVQVTLTFEPEADREMVKVEISGKTKLTPPTGLTTSMALNFDSEGKPFFREMMSIEDVIEEQQAKGKEKKLASL